MDLLTASLGRAFNPVDLVPLAVLALARRRWVMVVAAVVLAVFWAYVGGFNSGRGGMDWAESLPTLLGCMAMGLSLERLAGIARRGTARAPSRPRTSPHRRP